MAKRVAHIKTNQGVLRPGGYNEMSSIFADQ